MLSWYGISVYGTVDTGGGYHTDGAPFNGAYEQGASYSIQKMNRQPMWTLAPSGVGATNIGIRGAESIGGDWKAIFQLEAGFDPDSLQLSNSAQSLFDNKGVPLNQQSANSDSSRGGQFYNSVGFVGVSSPTYGTLTFFRQNSLGLLDAFAAYDPLALSYAFSQIGFPVHRHRRRHHGYRARQHLGEIPLSIWRLPHRRALPVRWLRAQQRSRQCGATRSSVATSSNLGPGTLSLDAIYSYEKDAANLDAWWWSDQPRRRADHLPGPNHHGDNLQQHRMGRPREICCRPH